MLLHGHTPLNQIEADHLESIRSLVADANLFDSWDNPDGHLTASAWIEAHSGSEALLLYHAVLRR